jgi:hypothetical protein
LGEKTAEQSKRGFKCPIGTITYQLC